MNDSQLTAPTLPRQRTGTFIVHETDENIDEHQYLTTEDLQSSDKDSDWESDDHEEYIPPISRPVSVSLSPNPVNDDEKTANTKVEIIPQHNPHLLSCTSVDHFRIRSVTIFGDLSSLFRDISTEIVETDKQWKEQRKFIENEIIETEKQYCTNLNTLYNEILLEIFDKKLLDLQYKKDVISNLPQIQSFHCDYFVKELQNSDIIQTFNKSSDFLKMYIEFVKAYPKILDIFAVHGSKTNNSKLYKFLKQKRKQKKPLTNLLISPIQRIPRYMLLLQDIRNKTPTNYKDYKDIETALNKITEITNHINDRQKAIENCSQCLQIQQKLRGFKRNLVEPHRKYINQFTFHLKIGKKLKLTQFCVFSDTIIVTDQKWKVIQTMQMRSVLITIIPNISTHYNPKSKGFVWKYGKTAQVYYDTQETMTDDCEELVTIIANEKQSLFDNDQSLFNGKSNTVRSNMESIQKELKFQIERANTFKSDGKPQRTRDRAKTESIWSKSLKLNGDTMFVEWKFIDVNREIHCVSLTHQQIIGNINLKSMRTVNIDGIEKFRAGWSNKSKFKFDYNTSKKANKNGKKHLSLVVGIEYDRQTKTYSYPLKINGQTYLAAFNEWKKNK